MLTLEQKTWKWWHYLILAIVIFSTHGLTFVAGRRNGFYTGYDSGYSQGITYYTAPTMKCGGCGEIAILVEKKYNKKDECIFVTYKCPNGHEIRNGTLVWK